jgi:hypothetical protein
VSIFGFGKKKPVPRQVEERAPKPKYSFVSSEALKQMATQEFREASPFVRAYGNSLAYAVPYHIDAIILGADHAPEIVEPWQRAGNAMVRDLAALLGWLHAKSAFADVDEIFKPEARETMYRRLMTVSGNFFGTEPRAMALCQQYEACLQGGYRELGGGTLAEGGTYFVHPDNAFMTTHLWMINESLGGPPLNMMDGGTTEPKTIYYLQNYTCSIMMEIDGIFRTEAKAELAKLR